MKSKTDASYGIIPIRRVGETWEVFLIHQFSRIGNNSYWVFPKGHPEGEETPKQTAARELKEETGLVADKTESEPVFKLEYSFVFDGVRINKTVEFFIGVIFGQEAVLDPEEVKEAGWYSLEGASERLDYKDTKQMFGQARYFIENYQG
ncbi:MAG: NUDIX domain-containing protein [Candidatus Pacebacteria bacterium]|nr:NUDIX domain-containing protein [Candidatus Paceibacterota bacterium]